LDVGQKEIAAGFGYIQSRLDDALITWRLRKIEETLKTDYVTAALAEANLIFRMRKPLNTSASRSNWMLGRFLITPRPRPTKISRMR